MGARREDIYERAKAITAEWPDARLLPELANADGSRDSDVIVDQRGLVMRLAGEFSVNRATAAGAVIRVIKERRAARLERLVQIDALVEELDAMEPA